MSFPLHCHLILVATLCSFRLWGRLPYSFTERNGGLEGRSNLLVLLMGWAGFPGGSDGKNLSAMWETQVQTLGWEVREDPLEKGTATHSSILAWRIPRTEEPGRLQSKGLQRVGHDWVTHTHTHTHTHTRLWGEYMGEEDLALVVALEFVKKYIRLGPLGPGHPQPFDDNS